MAIDIPWFCKLAHIIKTYCKNIIISSRNLGANCTLKEAILYGQNLWCWKKVAILYSQILWSKIRNCFQNCTQPISATKQSEHIENTFLITSKMKENSKQTKNFKTKNRSHVPVPSQEWSYVCHCAYWSFTFDIIHVSSVLFYAYTIFYLGRFKAFHRE